MVETCRSCMRFVQQTRPDALDGLSNLLIRILFNVTLLNAEIVVLNGMNRCQPV